LKLVTSLLCCALLLPAAPQQDSGNIPGIPRIGVSGAEHRISLDEAIQMALKNNLDIAIERQSLANAQQLIRAAEGAFDTKLVWKPSLASNNTPVTSILQGANGKLSEHFYRENFGFVQLIPHTGAQVGVEFDNACNSSSNIFNSLNPFYTSQLTVNLSVPLLRNWNTDENQTDILIRRKQAEGTTAQFEVQVTNIITQVQQAYWDLVAARQDTEVEGEAVKLADEQLARDQREINAGTLAPVEVYASRAELERRRDSQIASATTLTQAENTLKTLLLPDRHDPLWSAQFIPVNEDLLTPTAPINVNDAVVDALKRRPELRDVESQQATNKLQYRLYKNQTLPQANLTASYSNQGLAGTLRPGEDPFTQLETSLYQRLNDLSVVAGLPPVPVASFGGLPPSVIGGYGTAANSVFSGRFQSVQAGLDIEWSPRNRTARAHLAESAIDSKRLQLEQSRTEQMIQAEVRNALQALDSAHQRVIASQASVDAAQQKLDSETRLFRNGESTNFLVLTRQNEYLDSRHRLLLARLDYNRAVARLEQSTGSTLQSHHVQVVQ
jgi:HAE1 family hydrophobic/amphiphilic exporter-1